MSDQTSPFKSRVVQSVERARSLGKFAWLLIVVIIVLPVLWYGVGGVLVHTIDDDTTYAVVVEPGASKAVATAEALIRRETETHRWTASDPFFMPSSWLDNMPNFQQGLISALSRFAIEMSDQIGRVRGSSQVDADLDKAAGLLKYPGHVWIFDLSTSLAPTAPARSQYLAAANSLASYNARLAQGDAVFERRSDNLLATIDRITADLGSASAVIDEALVELGAFSFDADDVFYRTKGRLYGYFMLLEGMGEDFREVLQERDLDTVWAEMLKSLRAAAEMDPLLVINGAPDGPILPSHLAAQGFFLLRTRTQLKEITNVLLK